MPLLNCRNNTHCDNLVTKCAEVLVRLYESSVLLLGTVNWENLNTVSVELSLHSHHNVVELAIVYIATSWPTECLTTHSSSDHLDRNERWALERRTATEVDDVLTTLDYALTESVPISLWHTLGADDVGERSAINSGSRCKYCHLLAVTTIGTRVNNLVSRYVEVLCQLAAETSRVESSQSSNLRWLNTSVDQSDKTSDISRIEDNYDVLYISSIEDVEDIKYINIYGEVAFPGKYRFAHNTKIGDVILMAGGLTERASTARIEVVRRNYDPAATADNDTIAQTYTFEIDNDLSVVGGDDFSLMPYDAVYVRRSPSYTMQGNVTIEGEVIFAGTYIIGHRNMRISELVKNSGGFTNNAYIEGACLERKLTSAERERMRENLRTVQSQMDSTYLANIEIPEHQNVGIDLAKAIEEPGGEYDIILKDGDRLIIPEFVNTVTISGNVMYPNTVTYVEGENLNYYINLAGGYGLNAKKSKAIIIYKNGTIARAKNRASLIKPGCEIIVPTKVKTEGMSAAEIFSMASTSASLATVIISLINLITR